MPEETITLTRTEYQDLVDARDHAIAMRDVATGAMETLADAELDAYLAAPSPLAFWRKRRGLTQAALASEVGITQAYLAQIERGVRTWDVQLYARLAKTLRVPIRIGTPFLCSSSTRAVTASHFSAIVSNIRIGNWMRMHGRFVGIRTTGRW